LTVVPFESCHTSTRKGSAHNAGLDGQRTARSQVACVARPARTDTYIERLKSNRVAVALAVAAALVVAAQLTGALEDIRQAVGGRPPGGRPASVGSAGGGACAGGGDSVAVHAYALALTNAAELRTFARDNATSLAADGDAVACYRLLAAALASNTNLSQLDALRDRAEAERQTGLEFDRAAYTTDLGGTLRELADSLPALAKGDDGPYRATRAYESAQAYSALLQRVPGSAAGIDTLIRADEEVLLGLAARLGGR
jgi:hypothetical protein